MKKEATTNQDIPKSWRENLQAAPLEQALSLANAYLASLEQEDFSDVRTTVEVMTFMNTLLRHHHHPREEDFFIERLKQALDTMQTDDDFLIVHYEKLYDEIRYTYHFTLSYDVLMKLVLLYRATGNEICLKDTYDKLLALVKRLEGDIIAVAKRRDRITCQVPSESQHLHTDPVEQATWFKTIEPSVHQAIYQRIGRQRKMGYVHGFWHEKETLLAEQYGIAWMSPQSLNRHIKFD